ncbi:hypothetical protein RFI_18445 [Reticulomyxa filosa]|uniref:Uncharacterized protein n=1 Tax=Reticulomyxa filosa TaxID=46433 RepID=X6MY98_RETFI|nr:hypothetical protein RFI_18445 [Reticulomyxa filosa]|eukprot:ETO18801.1 hypothetical protein RFI_18445 [Reticulomyxa filosa]
MKWSESGSALAIAWQKGIVVYCVSGVVAFSTLQSRTQTTHSGALKGVDKTPLLTSQESFHRNKDLPDDPLTEFFPSCLVCVISLHYFFFCFVLLCMCICMYVCMCRDGSKKTVDWRSVGQLIATQVDNETLRKGKGKEKERAFVYNDVGYLIQLQCMRHAMGNLAQNDIAKLAFLGFNYVSIWRPTHIIDDPERLLFVLSKAFFLVSFTDYWSRVEIEPSYLAKHGPIRELAVNPQSDCFAVSGTTGLALYYRNVSRWRFALFLSSNVCVLFVM